MAKDNEKIVNKTYTDPVTGKFKPGNPGGGRTKGSLDFKTKFYLMLDKIAEKNNMSAEEIEEQLFMVGYKKAKDGDYSFYRDIMDRVHGRPVQRQELTGADGKDLPTPILGTYVSTNNNTQENISNDTQDTSSTRWDISVQNDINTPMVDTVSTDGQGTNTDISSSGVNSSLETRSDEGFQEYNAIPPILERL